MHDLHAMVDATTYKPPAWQAALGAKARPYPFWWTINAIAQGALDNMDLPGFQPRSDHVAMRDIRPPVRSMGGSEFFVADAFKALLRQMGRALATPPEGEVDVLAAVPQRGWEQGRGLHSFEHDFLGPVLQKLAEEDLRIATGAPLLRDRYNRIKALRQAVRRGRVQGLPHEWIDTYWNRDASSALRETTVHFRRLFLDTDVDLGLSLPRDQEERFRAWLSGQAVRIGFFAGLHVAMMRLFERRRPRVLLTTMEAVGSARMWMFSARCQGVPSVSIQHGWIGPGHHGYFFAPPRDELGDLAAAIDVALPDRMCVFGKDHQQMLVQEGPWEGERVVVTGAPRCDRLVGPADQEKLRLTTGLRTELPWVLWATQTHGLAPEENKRNVATVENFLDDPRVDIEFLIKLHPAEDPAAPLYQSLARRGAHILGPDSDALSWLHAADVVMTKFSTVGLEAAVMGVPVVVLNTTGQRDDADFVEAGIALRATDGEGLRIAVRDALSGKIKRQRQKAYAERILGIVDGRAASRCAAVVIEAMGQQSSGTLGSG